MAHTNPQPHISSKSSLQHHQLSTAFLRSHLSPDRSTNHKNSMETVEVVRSVWWGCANIMIFTVSFRLFLGGKRTKNTNQEYEQAQVFTRSTRRHYSLLQSFKCTTLYLSLTDKRIISHSRIHFPPIPWYSSNQPASISSTSSEGKERNKPFVSLPQKATNSQKTRSNSLFRTWPWYRGRVKMM